MASDAGEGNPLVVDSEGQPIKNGKCPQTRSRCCGFIESGALRIDSDRVSDNGGRRLRKRATHSL